MSRVVCNVCGTSYSASADMCPICGYAKNGENVKAVPKAKAVEEVKTVQEVTVAAAASSSSHVKGGRYSKANVKKRNKGKPPVESYNAYDGRRKKQSSNAVAIVIIVILLLAIISVLGYIALRFFIPNDFLYEGFGPSQEIEAPVDPTDEEPQQTEPSLDCTGITLDVSEVLLDDIGITHKLTVSLEPAQTEDPVYFTSSDESVAIVSDDGTITAAGEGSAVITVTCGAVSAQCNVTCTVPEPVIELTLNRKEITFTAEGQSWVIYDGEIPVDEIVWVSDDNSVATIADGKVVAVAEGDTQVYAIYDEQSVSCEIHCKFEEESEEETGNVTEAESDPNKTYSLYNPFNPRNASDVTIGVGEKFMLMLVDENQNEVKGVQWSVTNEGICTVVDGFITGVRYGMTEVVATYNGKTYTCIIRVA